VVSSVRTIYSNADTVDRQAFDGQRGFRVYPIRLVLGSRRRQRRIPILFDQLILQLALVENVAFVGSHNKWDVSTIVYAGAGT
jgi:hypothetical protein